MPAGDDAMGTSGPGCGSESAVSVSVSVLGASVGDMDDACCGLLLSCRAMQLQGMDVWFEFGLGQ